MKPPVVTVQDIVDRVTYQLAPGVHGSAFAAFGRVFIPHIVADKEGSGDVGRFLDSLDASCVIVCVVSDRLRGMLQRRGWRSSLEPTDDGTGTSVIDMWVRG